MADNRSLTMMNLGDSLRKEGRNAEAANAFDRAIAAARETPGESPAEYPEVLSRVGSFYMETGRNAQALRLLTEAVAGFERLHPMPLAESAFAWNALGMAQLNLGSAKGAQESLRQAVALSTQAHGEEHPETAGYQTNLALALLAESQFDRAELLLRRARVVIERDLGPSSVALGVVFAELCAAASAQDKLAAAEDYGEQAVEIYSRQPVPDTKSIAIAELQLADVYLKRHRLEDADRLIPDAVAKERAVAADTRLLADGVKRLADLRAMQRSWREARDLYREAIDLYDRTLGPKDPVLRPVLLAYAEVLKHNAGSKHEVKALAARVRTIDAHPRT